MEMPRFDGVMQLAIQATIAVENVRSVAQHSVLRADVRQCGAQNILESFLDGCPY
jgi:hypothetical protein